MINDILMPINNAFLDVFDTFMNEDQKTKIRANSVRQYVEGIIDLLLRDKIVAHLGHKEIYEGVNWKRKIMILRTQYDDKIANTIERVFQIGGNGSHFNGKVSQDELDTIINSAIHIVEDIFVKYFSSSEHRFGSENLFTVFSMLPLKHRIYILEKLYYDHGDRRNIHIVDRLSLAYAKNYEMEKAQELLDNALSDNVICPTWYQEKLESLYAIIRNLDEINSTDIYSDELKGIPYKRLVVVGMPTSKNIFDSAAAVVRFKKWLDEKENDYPEFINLFFYLMMTDQRKYK